MFVLDCGWIVILIWTAGTPPPTAETLTAPAEQSCQHSAAEGSSKGEDYCRDLVLLDDVFGFEHVGPFLVVFVL